MFRKGFFLIDTNGKMWWSTEKFFLEEIKLLLPYFVEFEEDGKILPKKYPSNFAVGGPD